MEENLDFQFETKPRNSNKGDSWGSVGSNALKVLSFQNGLARGLGEQGVTMVEIDSQSLSTYVAGSVGS